MTRSQRNITPGKGDISTWLDCPYIGKDDWSKLGDGCRHDKGCYNPCIWNLGTRTCPEGYAR